jgi:integrase
VKLLMLTAARRDDVFAATRHEVKDLGRDARIEVPPERYKTDEPFTIMLTPAAVDLIKSLPRNRNCPFLFTNDGHRMLSSFSKAKARLDEISEVTGWVLHDLRRTARGRMRKLKVPHHSCEAVLGHVLPGIAGTYDVEDWDDEKRDALLRWEKALLAIVEPPPAKGGNVVVLGQRQAA